MKLALLMGESKTQTTIHQNKSGFKSAWQTKCVDFSKNYSQGRENTYQQNQLTELQSSD